MNILVLAAGDAHFDSRDGDYPLCLMEFNGVPLIEALIDRATRLKPARFIFALRDHDVQKYHLDNVVTLLTDKPHVLRVRDKARGAACTALLAAGMIDNDEELLIMNANELLDADFSAAVTSFRDQKLDAGVITFLSVHPRYSYVRLESEGGYVVEAAEKNPISRHATAGFYWFLRGKDFVKAAKTMIRKDAHINDTFYICPTLNELILNQAKIGIFPVDASCYHPLKTERQILQYEAALGKIS